ncbi:PilW family protein [Hydrogenophaga laconesensis]|uniref:Type IV pilus assembly protein PilW n=1 Tax=Hydrogenophaga laconesensis TaxID=1805971 RepID=A0ABU1V5J8_9BURK|nr:PilW family protein [Hydrogenophaga laconesensis]MDR7092731.1 type IV pilus assembly protein PilW [Hydrogenophaga laconesensis]
MQRPPRQRGMTLVELLIGLVIGLLVVVAAMGSLVHMRTASFLIGDSTRLQQEAATAFRIIGSVARQAGARHLENTLGAARVVFNPQYAGYGIRPDTGHAISIRGTDGASGLSDTLEIRRDAGVWEAEGIDCLGEATNKGMSKSGEIDSASQKEITNAFSVIADRLRCDGSGPTPGSYGVVSGVEDFQVWYGVREGNALRYTTATALARVSPAPWDRVETLRICLRLVGESRGHPAASAPGCQGETVESDGRLRRVFFRVFQLRNAGP